MNDTKQTSIISQSSLPSQQPNTNGVPNSCSASTSSHDSHHPPIFTTPTKNENLKSSLPQQLPTSQYKTLQIIPQSNQQRNCVVVQQVPGNNHSLNLISTSDGSQFQGQATFRPKHATINTRPVSQVSNSTANQNGDGNGITPSSHLPQQQPAQISTRFARIQQLQDGRQVFQLPNGGQYVQISNATGQQKGQQIMTFVHPQQQFVSRNGAQTQNVIIASQAQDGSRTATLQAVPAQIHTIQHTVRALHPNAGQTLQLRRQDMTQMQNNGTRHLTPPNQSKTPMASDGSSQAATSQSSYPTSAPVSRPSSSVELSKGASKVKTIPVKGATPAKTKVMKLSAQTQQITNQSGQPTATIQQIALPPNTQFRFSNPEGKDIIKGMPIQTRTITNYVQIPQPQAVPTTQVNSQNIENSHGTATAQQHHPPKPQPSHQQIVQHIPANAIVQSVSKNNIVKILQNPENSQPSSSRASQANTISSDEADSRPNSHISISQASTQKIITLSKPLVKTSSTTAASTNTIKISQVLIKPKPAAGSSSSNTDPKSRIQIVQTKQASSSPIPSDPCVTGKLNIDLSGGDPKESYRVLKKHFKFLVYENECYQGQLRDSHQRLLKLERDNNYLMDRLLKYETLSDSDGDESDTSIKTIEDKTLAQRAQKKRSSQRNPSNAPPKKKSNVKPSSSANPSPVPKLVIPTSKPLPVKLSSRPSLTSLDSPKPVPEPRTTASPPSNTSTHPTSSSSSGLSVIHTNMPLPSVYKPFPPSNTSTTSTPSTPTTTETSLCSSITLTPPKSSVPGMASTKKPPTVPKPAPPKARVVISELPKTAEKEVFRPKL